MRAVLYCRVSTLEQVENLSLSTQEASCRAYCAREGYDVDAVFVDRGESAKTVDRPEFQAMLRHCRKRRTHLHAVVVYGLSRFSRNSADHHAIATLLRGLGIALRSVTEPIDETPAGRFMEGILASMHQFDNEQKAERSKAGMQAATARGRWVWKAPRGYRTGAKGEPSIVPDPAIAPLLTDAWRALASTPATPSDILARLHAAGLTGRRGTPLPASTLRSILRNPVYTGRLECPSLGASCVGDWQPLVDEVTFTAVRVKLAKVAVVPMAPARPYRRQHADFPLRGFVSCATCGGGLTGSWTMGRSRRYGYYHCTKACPGARVGRDELEAAWLAFLDASRPTQWYIDLVRGIIRGAVQKARAEQAATRAAIGRRVEEAHRRIRLLDEAFLYEQAIDRATYHQRRQEALELLQAADSEQQTLSAEGWDLEGALSLAEACHLQGSKLWTAARTVDDRIRLQSALCPAGLVWGGGQLSNRLSDSGYLDLAPIRTGWVEGVAHPAATWHRVCLYLKPWRVFADSGGAALLVTV